MLTAGFPYITHIAEIVKFFPYYKDCNSVLFLRGTGTDTARNDKKYKQNTQIIRMILAPGLHIR